LDVQIEVLDVARRKVRLEDGHRGLAGGGC
jgi:hypothetical protein